MFSPCIDTRYPLFILILITTDIMQSAEQKSQRPQTPPYTYAAWTDDRICDCVNACVDCTLNCAIAIRNKYRKKQEILQKFKEQLQRSTQEKMK